MNLKLMQRLGIVDRVEKESSSFEPIGGIEPLRNKISRLQRESFKKVKKEKKEEEQEDGS